MRGVKVVGGFDDLVERDVALVAVVEHAAADAEDERLVAGDVVGQAEARREQDAVVLDQTVRHAVLTTLADAVGQAAALRHDAADVDRGTAAGR